MTRLLACGLLTCFILVGSRAWAGQHVLSVRGESLELNGRPLKLIGLRCSNALISDGKTEELAGQLDVFSEYGVNAISVYLMGSRFGDVQGYHPDSTLDPEYARRLSRIIEAADNRGMVVLVGCLYWGDSKAKADLGKWTQADADLAVANTVRWLSERNYRNVFVDPDNEGMAAQARGWDLAGMIRAAHAVDPAILMAANAKNAAPSIADLLIHHSPPIVGKPWVETEGTPDLGPESYWGNYSRRESYSNYIRIGRYSEAMKAAQFKATQLHLDNHAGYFLASTYLQCGPAEGVGGPFMNPGGMSGQAGSGTELTVLTPEAGVRWWLEWIKRRYGSSSQPGLAVREDHR